MTKPNRITLEELELVRDYIVLLSMMTVVERSREEIEFSIISLKSVYLSVNNALMDRVHSDLATVKRKLRTSGIKVWEDERDDFIVYYRYVCRGYEDRFGMTREVIKSQISMRMGHYITDIHGSRKTEYNNHNL